MTVGIESLKEVVTGIFGVAKFGIKVFKAVPKLKEEVKDLDVGEGSALVVQIVVQEIPSLLEELKK